MAANSSSKQKQKITQLIGDLQSGNENKISTSLKALQSNGDLSVLEPIAALLLTRLTDKNRQEVLEFLSTLNVSEAVDTMMGIVKNEDLQQVRQQVLSTLWNSKLDYSYYLPDFVEIAVDGDFMEALECLTIIENMEGPFEERHILEAKLHLKDYLEDDAPKDPQKAQILSEIALLLKDFDNLDEEDINFFNE